MREDSTLDTMLSTADGALYEAKRLGRNRVEIAESQPTATRRLAAAVAQRVA